MNKQQKWYDKYSKFSIEDLESIIQNIREERQDLTDKYVLLKSKINVLSDIITEKRKITIVDKIHNLRGKYYKFNHDDSRLDKPTYVFHIHSNTMVDEIEYTLYYIQRTDQNILSITKRYGSSSDTKIANSFFVSEAKEITKLEYDNIIKEIQNF